MPSQPFITLICLFLLFESCAYQSFTEKEKQRIQQYNPKESMRVYLITQKQDSLLLRTQSSKIRYQKDKKWVKELAQKMLITARDSAHLGVGIAAPQVGILKQMVLVQRFDKDEMPFEVYINPKITYYSKKKQECVEGCLSVPDFQANMYVRAEEIDLKYKDIEGKKHKEKVKGFTAVIFQHEIDHLNGILFIDYLNKN